MAGKLKTINVKDIPTAGSQRNVDKGGTPSSDPSKAGTRQNLKTVFGTPKNE
jgi:hypothetical protein